MKALENVHFSVFRDFCIGKSMQGKNPEVVGLEFSSQAAEHHSFSPDRDNYLIPQLFNKYLIEVHIHSGRVSGKTGDKGRRERKEKQR